MFVTPAYAQAAAGGGGAPGAGGGGGAPTERSSISPPGWWRMRVRHFGHFILRPANSSPTEHFPWHDGQTKLITRTPSS